MSIRHQVRPSSNTKKMNTTNAVTTTEGRSTGWTR
jgi:hypothetical protein